MEAQNVDILINEADQLLQKAIEELQRSKEDVAAYLICHNSRQSINNYLAAYLIKNGIEIIQPATMASLMEQCRALDARFELVDISQIFCRHDETDEEYCLNVKKVDDCLRIANQTRDIATQESPTY